MKLKFYLRGLGIGILITALILVLSGNGGKKMSDEDVMKRATELGMVMDEHATLAESATTDETDAVKEEVPEQQKMDEKSDVTEGNTDKQENTAPEKNESDDVKNEVAEAEQPNMDKENSLDDKTQVNVESVSPAEEIETAAPSQDEKVAEDLKKPEKSEIDNGPVDIVTVTVHGGDSSVRVAQEIKNAGLIESAAEFDRYLCSNGYDKKICVGTYEIEVGATNEEIAKKICGR